MLDVTPTPLQRLLRERPPGYTLPAAFYLSPEVFAAAIDVIFGRHWIDVGVEPDVPEAGDVMVVDVGTTSVAIAPRLRAGAAGADRDRRGPFPSRGRGARPGGASVSTPPEDRERCALRRIGVLAPPASDHR